MTDLYINFIKKGKMYFKENEKWTYIEKISKKSDKYGDRLIEMMELYNRENLCEITLEEVMEFYEKIK